MNSEIFKADRYVYNFLTRNQKINETLREALEAKGVELGLFNIYTEDGQAKVQTDMNAAIFASKFEDFLQIYKDLYYHMFRAMGDIKDTGGALAFLYSHLGMIY